MKVNTQINRNVTLQYENAQKNKALNKGTVHTENTVLQKENSDQSQDVLSVSKEGMLKLQEAEEQSLLQQYQEQAQASREEVKSFKDMAKMMEIARRIANGDKVPAKDEQKLMEYNSEMYQAAKAAATLNENKKHKHYKSLFDEEEENNVENQSTESTSGADETEEIAQTAPDEGSGDAQLSEPS